MKYRILDNGVYRDMTQKEIKETQSTEVPAQPELTKEELLAQLAELQEKISKL